VLDGSVHMRMEREAHCAQRGSVLVVTAHQRSPQFTMQPVQAADARSVSIVLRRLGTRTPPTLIKSKIRGPGGGGPTESCSEPWLAPRRATSMDWSAWPQLPEQHRHPSMLVSPAGIAYVSRDPGRLRRNASSQGKRFVENVTNLTYPIPGFRVFLASVHSADNGQRASPGRQRSRRA